MISDSESGMGVKNSWACFNFQTGKITVYVHTYLLLYQLRLQHCMHYLLEMHLGIFGFVAPLNTAALGSDRRVECG